MKSFSAVLQDNLTALKKALPSEDILVHEFTSDDFVACAVVYADGMVNKELIGTLVERPLSTLRFKGLDEKAAIRTLENELRFPECKQKPQFSEGVKEVLDGNILLLLDGVSLDDMSRELNIKIIVTDGSGESFFQAFTKGK